MRKNETKFREDLVVPFLKTLKRCKPFTIQQMSIRGDPDLLLCLNSYFVALELKSRGGELRVLQEFRLGEVRKAGGVALVASPDNWEEIKIILTTIEKRGNK